MENIKNQVNGVRQQKCISRMEVLQQSQRSGQESYEILHRIDISNVEYNEIKGKLLEFEKVMFNGTLLGSGPLLGPPSPL